MLFQSKRPAFHHLKQKWTNRQRNLQDRLWDKHGESLRQLAVGSLSGLMLLSSPTATTFTNQQMFSSNQVTHDTDNNTLLAAKISKELPKEMRALTGAEEEKLGEILTKNFGFKVTAELNNMRLNRSYGMIGGEQHLYRFPGDNLQKHAETASDWAMFGPAGIAPGLGAWGYFASSESAFSEQDKLKEKYYLATQTFLAPGFAENVAKYRDFFKFRKMLVINPKTGQSVVAVIGDAGPAEWTGKHLGGSPEVMHFLGLASGPRKGAVIYFFIDDSEDQVPLGPIKLKDFRS